MNSDIHTTKDLFEHLVYFSHINKQTQYERPTFGTFHSKPLSNGIINNGNGNHSQSQGNVHHFSGASSSNFYNGNNNTNGGWNSQPPPPPAVYNTRPHQQPPPSQQQHHQQKQNLQQNGIVKNQSLNSQPHHQHHQQPRISPRGAMGYAFTTDISDLRGELITTRVQKGPKGLGFTLIGNDGTSSQPEFIQVKSVIKGGPAAMDNVLHPGDVLVYVNGEMMLGATQDDACKIFRMIPVGDYVTIQVCRGYPLLLDPTNKIITENVYTPPLNHHHRPRETLTIHITKGDRGYGFTITDTMQGQRVKSVLYPDQCPNLLEGDIIMEIDGQNVRHKPHLDVIEQLRNHPLGYKTTMIVSRNSPKHRSRTPTAAFRYGEQRATPVPIIQPRSKTPAPVPIRPNKSSAVRQYQPKNTLPKQTNGDKPDIYENASRMRPSSTTLGFASTPNYVPISAFAHDKPQGHQLITVNLIKRADGFGFRLLGGQEVSDGTVTKSEIINIFLKTNSPLIVGQVVPGGAAALDGRLKPNDEIIEIDGQNVEYSTHKDVVEKIRKAGDVGHVKLVVRRIRDDLPRSTSLPFSYNYSNPLNGTLQSDIPHLPMATAHPATADSTYHVDLAKLDSEDFGCTIVSLNNRYIGNIIPDSPADRCGRLHPGDCVIAINHTPLYNLSHQQVIHYIKNSGNTITFTIDPAKRIPAPVNTMPTFQPDLLRNSQATPSQMYQQVPHRRFSNNYYASSPNPHFTPHSSHLIHSTSTTSTNSSSSRPYVHGTKISPPWYHHSTPHFACAYTTEFAPKYDSALARNIIYIPAMSAVIEATTPNDGIFSTGATTTTILPAPLPGRPQMGIYATRKQIFSELDPALLYHFAAEPLDYKKFDEYNNISAAEGYPSSPAEHGSLIRVELPRGNKGFGFSIRGGWEFEQMPLRILKIAEDGPAAANGNLRVGDLIIEINGESTLRMTHERAIQLIKEQNVVRLLVQRPVVYGRDG
uniref:PDZ domain-containing protein n=1 Tax=Panagrolaimus superbus TaxID=310955 RepID=A0A914Z8H2_9BILA